MGGAMPSRTFMARNEDGYFVAPWFSLRLVLHTELHHSVRVLARGTTNRTERKTQAEVVQPDCRRPA